MSSKFSFDNVSPNNLIIIGVVLFIAAIVGYFMFFNKPTKPVETVPVLTSIVPNETVPPSKPILTKVDDGYVDMGKIVPIGYNGLVFSSMKYELFDDKQGAGLQRSTTPVFAAAIPDYVAKKHPEYVGKYNLITVWGDDGMFNLYNDKSIKTHEDALEKIKTTGIKANSMTFSYL